LTSFGKRLADFQGVQFQLARMATDVETVLGSVNIDRAPVLGWSLGGFVAQRLAIRAPGRVDALVLAATDPGGPSAILSDPTVRARLTDHSGTPAEQAKRLLSVLFPPAVAAEIEREVGDEIAAARAALSPDALRAQEEAMDAWHAEEPDRPGPDAPPVLALCGTEDVVIPPANTDLLAERWPRCHVERFYGGGHGFLAQEPDLVASLIRGFLG
jgi:3-oxoadipate enol-lactonase